MRDGIWFFNLIEKVLQEVHWKKRILNCQAHEIIKYLIVVAAYEIQKSHF